ncbi:MAG: thiamine pyrophosphate-binding protein [Rhizobiaceae bacterium]
MLTEAKTRVETGTVGDAIARHLADAGVKTVFGVISIHNMPILDAIARQKRIRFVPARGEAGAMNMADAYARVSRSVGVVITSTGTGAANAAGAQVEALTAGSPVLHITTQVDSEFMDQDRAAIHDVPRQADMLKAVSKACFRILNSGSVHTTLAEAIVAAKSPPAGPVSLEIPVDVQRHPAAIDDRVSPPELVKPVSCDNSIDALAEMIKSAHRPMIWLGGGARECAAEANELVARGLCAVTSTNGRAVVDERNPATLGAFNMTPEAADIYSRSDLMIVVGSRLRGNETRNFKLPLPTPLAQIDADASQNGRNYPADLFIHGDAKDTLRRLLERLPERLQTDAEFRHSIAIARANSEGRLRDQLGVYRVIADALQERVSAGGHPFVRDVTISNSTFGNRYVQIDQPHHGVHALGGGIGQGIAMGIGAGLVDGEAKSIVLVGDGGAQLGQAELITAVEEKANLVFVLMNDQAYGVIKNIQDAQYEGRRVYSALATPDFELLCRSVGLPHIKVSSETSFAGSLDEAIATEGPVMVEVDMCAIGPFAQPFAGPPAGAAGSAG